jgi:hypothetical protein
MHVVRHEAESVQPAMRARQEPAQVEKIKLPIFLLEETVRPVVAALHYVNGNPGKHDARASGHAEVNGLAPQPLTRKNVVRP